jgi:hypothetical protein
MREVGASGLKRFSGFVYEEFLRELVGWKGVAIYKEMANNDPTVNAVLFAITMLCRGVQWRAKPASEQPYDKEAADFLESCMNDMSQSWTDTISEILTMLQYGYSAHEIVYKRRCGQSGPGWMKSKHADGRIGWRKIPLRSQDTIYRWLFDDHGGIKGVQQLAPPHYYLTEIPIEKMLLFRTAIDKNNPEGRSILRGAYRPWYMKKNIENIEAIGIERDLAGLPVALVPPELLSSGANAGQKAILQNLKEIVTNIRRDEQEGIVFPMAYDTNGKLMYELKLLSTGGQRQFDTDKIIQRYDQRIAMTALADFILIGHSNVGSFALQSSKTELFSVAIGAFLDIIADVFNRFAIPRLFELNDFEVTDYPTLVHGDLETIDLKDLGAYISSLASAGYPLFPSTDGELEKYLMKIAGLPEPIDPLRTVSQVVAPPRKTTDEFVKQVEIPYDDKQRPQGANSGDTTPVNGQPATPIVTNATGDTEQQSAMRAAAARQLTLNV